MHPITDTGYTEGKQPRDTDYLEPYTAWFSTDPFRAGFHVGGVGGEYHPDQSEEWRAGFAIADGMQAALNGNDCEPDPDRDAHFRYWYMVGFAGPLFLFTMRARPVH